jgi:hypothetical protein
VKNTLKTLVLILLALPLMAALWPIPWVEKFCAGEYGTFTDTGRTMDGCDDGISAPLCWECGTPLTPEAPFGPGKSWCCRQCELVFTPRQEMNH